MTTTTTTPETESPFAGIETKPPETETETPNDPFTVAPKELFLVLADSKESGPVFFDLETIPDEDHERVIVPRDDRGGIATDAISAEAILKSVDTLKAFIGTFQLTDDQIRVLKNEENKREKPRKGIHETLDGDLKKQKSVSEARRLAMSVVPEYCRIAAVGITIGNDDIYSTLCETREDERDALTAFWRLLSYFGPPCGYNIANFDLPVIFARSAILGVESTVTIDTKPWGKGCIDIYARRFPRGSSGSQPGKMKELASLYNIDVPAGDVDGSQVAELFKSDPAKVAEYVRSDVHITRELYRKWKGLFF